MRAPRTIRHALGRAAALGFTLLVAAAPPAVAAWIGDANGNRIDDLIEAVESQGIAAAFENGDPVGGRALISLFDAVSPLRYGVFVHYDHQPTPADLDALRASGVSTAVLHPYTYIPDVYMQLTFAEIQTVAALAGVSRVEAEPMLYAVNNNATKTSGVRDSGFRRFPTVREHLGLTGKGIVISVMDTGVNDAPESLSGYPGHESLLGKFVAGGEFPGPPEAGLNTPPDQSVNPVDRGEDGSSTHGSHVAGTVMGTGGASGIFGGVAPDALLVDLKVLSDAGAGFTAATNEAFEWAIASKDVYAIRILNLSLSGLLENSDGTDATSRMANAAVEAGLVVVAAASNDGETNWVGSPAAADKAFAIGNYQDRNSIDRSDDAIAPTSNEGPRLDDGDEDFEDEMKPLVAAPGSGIVSVDGSLLTDGRQYQPLSGTSMASPHVAGVVALLLEAKPDLSPAQIMEILKHTSEHRRDWGKTPPDANPFPQGDPNYHPSGGWGQLDAYAAAKEALRLAGDLGSRTQVVFIHAAPAADGSAAAVEVTWKSQREIDLVGYDLYRAEDVGGAPGTFVKVNPASIPGVGQAQIEGVGNRNLYSFLDTSGLAFGRTYWYRLEHSSSDPAVGTIQEPALAVTLGEVRPVARLSYSITHNALDSDLLVLLGTGPQTERPRFVVDGKSSSEADLIADDDGVEATTGFRRHEFSIVLTSRNDVEAFLPPSKQNPWFLLVKEGGFINRAGRVNSFLITLLDADGSPTQTFATGDPTPQPTVEGETTVLWIPDDPDVALPGDAPTVIEAEPAAGAQGAAGLSVDVYGAEFLPGAAVSVSGEGVSVDGVQFVRGSNVRAAFTIASDAPAGPRDVTVTNLDGGSGTGVGVFTVTGNGGDDPVITDVEDGDAAVEYKGGWHRKKSTAASAGTYHRRMGGQNGGNGPPPAARVVFTGSQITLFYGRSEIGGTADVYLDGALQETLSFSGAAPHNDPAFGHAATYEVPEGVHELRIEHRTGAVDVDGFRIVSRPGGGADADAPESRSVTTASTGTLSGVGATQLLRTVEVGDEDETLSVVVEGAASTLTVNLLDASGALVATGDALLEGVTAAGLDTSVSAPGTYTVQVISLTGATPPVEVSIARTVRVR